MFWLTFIYLFIYLSHIFTVFTVRFNSFSSLLSPTCLTQQQKNFFTQEAQTKTSMHYLPNGGLTKKATSWIRA